MAPPRWVLAGDLGGTKTLLALYRHEDGRLERVREVRYASGDYARPLDLLAAFLDGGVTPAAACFGIAGPVAEGRCHATNLPWLLDEKELSGLLGGIPVRLVNDLEATACGLLRLPAEAFCTLSFGLQVPGNIAVVAAGTGLGEAILCWKGNCHSVIATEGGHCDFAPADELQDGLLGFLRQRYGGHVSYERVLSGNGLYQIYQFLSLAGGHNPAVTEAMTREDPAAVIAHFGLEGSDALCRQALSLFARIYGQEAGNLALKCLARGGVLLAGGIAPKILPILQEGAFLEGFFAKGRFGALLRGIPVRVCLEPAAPLLGAAWTAVSLLE